MKKYQILSILFILFAFGCTSLEHIIDNSGFNRLNDKEKSFMNWSTFYYQHPTPSTLTSNLSYYSNSKIFDKYEDSRMPYAYFFGAAYSANPEKIDELITQLTETGSENAKVFALHVFWVMDDDAATKYLNKVSGLWKAERIQTIIGKMRHNRPHNILEEKPDVPVHLDDLWANFFATGNPKAVEQIASTLHVDENASEYVGEEVLLKGSARWSLTSNAMQHEAVLGILEALAEKETGSQKEELMEIIKKAKGRT